MKRLLDIEYCQQCKHVNYAKNVTDQFMLCLKSNKIIKQQHKEIHGNESLIYMDSEAIPDWCSLSPIVPISELIETKQS